MRTEHLRRAAGRRRVRLALTLAATCIAIPLTTSGAVAAEPRPIHDADAAPVPAVTFDDAFVDDGRTGPIRSVAALESCPVDGDHFFEDSWGWPRSGGRTHEGVDLIAERGTPVVAVRDGELEHTQSSRGGRSAWLITDEGTRFYYAHLDEWRGSARTVRAGEVIGTVGSTGNARGPHLHFEIRPGREAIDPFVHAIEACGEPTASEPTVGSDAVGDRLLRPI